MRSRPAAAILVDSCRGCGTAAGISVAGSRAGAAVAPAAGKHRCFKESLGDADLTPLDRYGMRIRGIQSWCLGAGHLNADCTLTQGRPGDRRPGDLMHQSDAAASGTELAALEGERPGASVA